MKAVSTENWNNCIKYFQATETAMRKVANITREPSATIIQLTDKLTTTMMMMGVMKNISQQTPH